LSIPEVLTSKVLIRFRTM